MSYTHHPKIEREKVYRTATIQRYLFAPVFLIMYIIRFFVRLFGKESSFLKFMFSKTLESFKEKKKAGFKGYTPSDKDVFACCYSKSGTNWILMITYQIANKGKGEFDFIHDVVPWPHSPKEGFSVPLDHKMANESLTGLRPIKCNAELESPPYSKDAKYICLLRDPKSVFVSAYHFVKSVMMGPMMPSVDTFLDLFLSDNFVAGDWASYAEEYWNWRTRPNVLFITFEEMKDDLEGNIQKIAKFMEVELTEDELKKVHHLSSYKHMKSIDYKFAPGRIFPLGQKSSELIRTGKKNSSGELLSKEQQNRIDDYFITKLKERGSDFPYEEMYANKL
ncbi:MAG: sulfotransferase domain-containing protein [Aureispira sp.]|nr:sulfotransferase domain-containing protein [Aureispira sp.]